MKNKEFLKQLSALLNRGEIISEEVLGNTGGPIGTIPRIYGNIDGYLVKFDFVSFNEVKLEVDMKPQHYLYLRHFSKFSNLLKKIKMARDVKISNEEFNQKYYLRNVEPEVAERTLSFKNIALLEKLEPFDHLEQTFKEYRLLKDITKAYTPDQAFAELNAMVQFVKNCDAEWGTDRKLV